MGLFKKKKAKSEIDETFERYGSETNAVKDVRKEKRADSRANAEQARVSATKKDQILEKMSQLRKVMYTVPNFDKHSDRLEECIQKLKRISDNANVAAMSSVDNFILNAIIEAQNYCNRGNYVATGAALSVLDELINDRQYCGNYYTDKEFIEFKLERNKKYIEQQNQQSKYDNLVKRLAELQADYNNPALVHSRENIAREAKRVKEEGQRTKSFLDELDARIAVLDKSINEIMKSDVNKGEIGFDMTDKLDSVLEKKRENEHEASTIDKFNDKLDESHRNISSSALNVNDETESSSHSETLGDDFFKM